MKYAIYSVNGIVMSYDEVLQHLSNSIINVIGRDVSFDEAVDIAMNLLYSIKPGTRREYASLRISRMYNAA